MVELIEKKNVKISGWLDEQEEYKDGWMNRKNIRMVGWI